jgi:hypothetical protein
MTVTKEMLQAAPHHQIWHYTDYNNQCTCVLGARGAIHLRFTACRTMGQLKTWKTRPNEFRLPVKHGMSKYGSAYIDHDNADHWHREEDCPALIKAQELRNNGAPH